MKKKVAIEREMKEDLHATGEIEEENVNEKEGRNEDEREGSKEEKTYFGKEIMDEMSIKSRQTKTQTVFSVPLCSF